MAFLEVLNFVMFIGLTPGVRFLLLHNLFGTEAAFGFQTKCKLALFAIKNESLALGILNFGYLETF